MAGLDKWLYNFARRKTAEKLRLTGVNKTIGAVTVKVLLEDSSGKILLCTGTTVPTDAGSGYAKGCLFIDTNVVTGTSGLYENVGTSTSCNFDLNSAAGATALTYGSTLIGDAGGAEAALDISGDGKITVGNGTTATSVAVSGDVTLSNAGAVAIAANKVLSTMMNAAVLKATTVSISAADICTATTIKTLVAAAASGYYHEFVSATLTYKRTTATYGAGGNLTIGWVSGAALTGLVSAANSFGAGASSIWQFVPLSTVAQEIVKETALGLQTSGQFTNPGTAAGTAECTIVYRTLPIET